MSEPVSHPALARAEAIAWARQQSGGGKVASRLPNELSADDTLVDVRGASGPLTLKAWVAQVLDYHADLKLRPIAHQMRRDPTGDDSASVVSVPRSFGLSTTTGARGDAVSYVLDAPSGNSSAASTPAAASPLVHGVVKVIKSQSTFRQELAALTLIRTVLPAPTHVHYPHAIGATWALIPTSIPVAAAGATSTSSAFARPYSVSSLVSSTAGSTSSSSSPDDTCLGGALLMDCAPGLPLAEFFRLVGQAPSGSPSREALLTEVATALRHAARALAELHTATLVPSLPPTAAHPFLAEAARQMAEMLDKLALGTYAKTRKRWDIDCSLLRAKLTELSEVVLAHPGPCCIIHGDAHAGNMLWDVATQRLTLIDLPTMLQATEVNEIDSDAQLQAGHFRIDGLREAECNAPAVTSSTTATPARHSAVCAHPPPGSLSLHGSAVGARDVSHFERKLDSFGSQASIEPAELVHLRSAFRSTYEEHGPRVTPQAEQFFAYRSILGEITQLVRHDPESITQRLVDQLREQATASVASSTSTPTNQ